MATRVDPHTPVHLAPSPATGPTWQRPSGPEHREHPAPWIANVARAFVEHIGQTALMTARAMRLSARRPLEVSSTLDQMEAMGVRSIGIATTTAIFVGMVMAVQFAYGLQKFGGMEYTGRVIGLSFSRELAPTLTAIVVGARIGAGIAAEIGSMSVTEQLDAIRALGADPIKKLVVPRLAAAIVVMPVLGALALVLGFTAAMIICSTEFGVPAKFFLQTALESVTFSDYLSGALKCPVFGAIIALTACHFGLTTRGGTEGVGRSTTKTVVCTSVAILVADFFLTKVSLLVFPSR
jgi:phospholipid/cholesterol/gamma-HCH transport system permease protein